MDKNQLHKKIKNPVLAKILTTKILTPLMLTNIKVKTIFWAV